MITDRYRGEYAHMMAEGEDTEEFLMRLIHPVGRYPGELLPEWGTEEADTLLMFRWQRYECLKRNITLEAFDEMIDDHIRAILTEVGQVKPDDSWVGYF